MNLCIHCNSKLGENLLLPEFPVGRRLAFDPANARLWAVCPKCQRWNLTWLDEPECRAAVARLDQYFAATPHRTESGGIGIAEVWKTSLIRIGAAPWAAFASWRYARRLWKRRLLVQGPILIALPFALWLWTPAGDAFLSNPWAFWGLQAFFWLSMWKFVLFTVMRVPAKDGKSGRVRATFAAKAAIQVDDTGWSLFVKHTAGVTELQGAEALRALSLLLPIANHGGASPRLSREAIALIERSGTPRQFLENALSACTLGPGLHRLDSLTGTMRIALEIAVNEEAERTVMRGDVAGLVVQRDRAVALAERIAELG